MFLIDLVLVRSVANATAMSLMQFIAISHGSRVVAPNKESVENEIRENDVVRSKFLCLVDRSTNDFHVIVVSKSTS